MDRPKCGGFCTRAERCDGCGGLRCMICKHPMDMSKGSVIADKSFYPPPCSCTETSKLGEALSALR